MINRMAVTAPAANKMPSNIYIGETIILYSLQIFNPKYPYLQLNEYDNKLCRLVREHSYDFFGDVGDV